MKAIYLNLDDALRAVLAGETPAQSQVPLAVTIPAGQTAAVFAQTGTASKTADAGSNVTGVTWTFSPSLGDAIAENVAPGMSQVLSSETASVYAVSGNDFAATATIKNGNTTVGTFTVQVVVNRETADGPVDLVDFTPPAAVTAASINTALGGSGAEEGAPLAGVTLKKTDADGLELFGAVIIGDDGESVATQYRNADGADNPVSGDPPGSLTYAIGHV